MSEIKISELMSETGVQFGTSGVRGLVKDMTDRVCWLYVTAFIQHLQDEGQLTLGSQIAVAGDLRASTPRIIAAAVAAIRDKGFVPVYCGCIPSPAIALYGLKQAIPTMMVTGSHIPDDRNGIKFNKADGEILKADEVAIKQKLVEVNEAVFGGDGQFLAAVELPELTGDAEQNYVARFVDFLPVNCLSGRKIGLGAEVISLARSEQFVAVDTEAIRPEDVMLAKQWTETGEYDCIISTDGDGDRPLISDETGNWLRGDVAGILCARYLQAENVVTPISSNSAVDKSRYFDIVERTRIGSPYVIEAMNGLLVDDKTVVGYEANGGFLQASELMMDGKSLSPLPTRDAVIVPLAVLLLAQQQAVSISELVEGLPARYTASDRLKNFPTELSQKILAKMQTGDLEQDKSEIAARFPLLGDPIDILC